MYRGYNTNNNYREFPPLMMDGRSIVSSYNPNAVITEKIVQDENLQTNWEYRNYMTRNADKVRRFNYLDSLNDMGYTQTPASVLYGAPVSTPYVYNSVSDNHQACGDVFPESDLKTLYMSREELNARKVAPVITKQQAAAAGIV
jgi:hypothetical protein